MYENRVPWRKDRRFWFFLQREIKACMCVCVFKRVPLLFLWSYLGVLGTPLISLFSPNNKKFPLRNQNENHSFSISPSLSPRSSPSHHLSSPLQLEPPLHQQCTSNPNLCRFRGCFNEPVCEDWFDWYLSRKHLIELDWRPWLVIWEEDDHRDAD